MTRRLNDVTPEEWDAVNYYKKLDERLPDDFWDGEPDLSVVKDDNWDESRMNVIGQNGGDGLHYPEITANNAAINKTTKLNGKIVKIKDTQFVVGPRGNFEIPCRFRGKEVFVEYAAKGYFYIMDSDDELFNAIPLSAIEEEISKESVVSKPKHYKLIDCEAIDMIADALSKEEFHGYCLGNVMKYRLRAGKKGDALEDLAKADEYEKIYERYYG